MNFDWISPKFVPKGPIKILQHWSPWTKWSLFRWRHFQMHFHKQFCILIRVSLKCVPKGLIHNRAALVQIMVCCLFGAKPLSKPMPTQIVDAYMRHQGHVPVNLKLVIFKVLSRVHILSILCEIVLRWMPQDLTDDMSTFLHVMRPGVVRKVPEPVLTKFYDAIWRQCRNYVTTT